MMKKLRLSSRLLIALASLSLTAAFFLPLWFIFLLAPQYPEGLTMQIWLNKLTGQVEIINGLNHYIGMHKIDAAIFPEFRYMSYGLGLFIAYGVLIAFSGSRKLFAGLLTLLVITASAGMYDFWKWGYNYGHHLDPKAAIQVPGLYYQPPLIGHKTLLNFDAYSYPDVGGWVIMGAGIVLFFVYFLEWLYHRKAVKKQQMFASSKVLIVSSYVLFFLCSCSHGAQAFSYGKDQCDDCRMTIVEPNFGAEIITRKGKVFKFDDVHCLAQFLKRNKGKHGDIFQTVFVDYDNAGNFINSNAAWFVVSPQLQSPMNGNAAAFATKEEATRKAEEVHGALKNWNKLLPSL